MIYSITLTNKKTGRDISRDYDLDKLLSPTSGEGETENVIREMREALDDDQAKF